MYNIYQYLSQVKGYKSNEDLVKTQIKFYLIDYTIVLFIILSIFKIKLENYIYSINLNLKLKHLKLNYNFL